MLLAGRAKKDPDCPRARRLDTGSLSGKQEITTVAAEDLVVVDESSTNIHLTPRMARAPRGQRAYGSVPRNTPPNTTTRPPTPP
jgi:hypothetical protein